MIDSRWRAPFQALLVDPLIGHMKRLRWRPHHLTAAALLLGICVVPALALDLPWLAAGALLLSGYLDALDGSFARATGRISDRGAAFDIVSDRVVEFCAILGLYLQEPETRGLPCLLMLGAAFVCVTSFLVVGIFTENNSRKSFHYSPGIMERAEAFLFFEAMILLPDAFTFLSCAFTFLVFATAFIRTWEFSRQ